MRHDHHFHDDKATTERLDRIDELLGIILDNQETIMATLEDLQAAQAETDVKIAAIKADVEELLAKLAAIPPAGLTPEQQAALDVAVAHAATINDGLAAIDTAAKA